VQLQTDPAGTNDDIHDGVAWWPLLRLLDARRSPGARRIALLFVLVNVVSVGTGVLNVTRGWNGVEWTLFGLTLDLTLYPPLVLSALAAVWLGPAWGVWPAYLANLASALASGLPLPTAAVFALAGAIETAILWASLVTLGIHPDLRRLRDWRRFLAVALVAPVAPSLAVLLWNTGHGLDFSAGQRLWRGWMVGDFLQAALVLGPLLCLAGPRVRAWVDQQFATPPRREVASTRHAALVYACLGLLGAVVFEGVRRLQHSLAISPAAVTGAGEPLLLRVQEMQFFLGLLLLAMMLASGAFSTALARMSERQRALARRESLTGCFNRRAFDEVFKRESDRCRRLRHGLSLIFIDADHFKDVNDRFGHAAGDRVLQQLALRVQAAVRDTDVLFRWGGEEFVLLLPHTPPGAARVLAERVRSAVADAPFSSAGEREDVRLTVSLGTAGTLEFPVDAQDLVAAADAACYQAKHAGRNRVTVTPEPLRAAAFSRGPA
jgi:diguanylate cyclase (GGDEF)-like protein